jgi:hypothetical protein
VLRVYFSITAQHTAQHGSRTLLTQQHAWKARLLAAAASRAAQTHLLASCRLGATGVLGRDGCWQGPAEARLLLRCC